MSNAARQDAPPGNHVSHHGSRGLGPREVAARCGVSSDTLRHYERKGLLPAPARTPAGYRRYPPDTVARVQLVQRALLVGFTLDQLAQVLRDRDRACGPCAGAAARPARRIAAGAPKGPPAAARESAAANQQTPPCGRVRDIVAARLADLEARLRELTALRRDLRQMLAAWDRRLAATPPGQPALLLTTLADHLHSEIHSHNRDAGRPKRSRRPR
jgi:DNA-binding transcriptional MerR regulator